MGFQVIHFKKLLVHVNLCVYICGHGHKLINEMKMEGQYYNTPFELYHPHWAQEAWVKRPGNCRAAVCAQRTSSPGSGSKQTTPKTQYMRWLFMTDSNKDQPYPLHWVRDTNIKLLVYWQPDSLMAHTVQLKIQTEWVRDRRTNVPATLWLMCSFFHGIQKSIHGRRAELWECISGGRWGTATVQWQTRWHLALLGSALIYSLCSEKAQHCFCQQQRKI